MAEGVRRHLRERIGEEALISDLIDALIEAAKWSESRNDRGIRGEKDAAERELAKARLNLEAAIGAIIKETS